MRSRYDIRGTRGLAACKTKWWVVSYRTVYQPRRYELSRDVHRRLPKKRLTLFYQQSPSSLVIVQICRSVLLAILHGATFTRPSERSTRFDRADTVNRCSGCRRLSPRSFPSGSRRIVRLFSIVPRVVCLHFSPPPGQRRFPPYPDLIRQPSRSSAVQTGVTVVATGGSSIM